MQQCRPGEERLKSQLQNRTRGAGHSQLNGSLQCTQVGKEANSTWPASDRVVSKEQGRELFSCVQWWWDCTLRAVFSLASQHEKVIELLECIQRRAMKLLKKLENDMWGNWGCLAQQRGGWEQTSLLSVIAWKEVVVKRVVVCFLTWQMTEHEEMVSSCAGGGLDCCHEEILPAVQWLGNGRGGPVQWWNCHPQMFLRDVWMWYSVM